MKLKSKVFAALTIVWTPLLVVAYLGAEQSSLVTFLLASFAIYGFTLWIIQSSLLKRIKKINHELEETKQTLQRVDNLAQKNPFDVTKAQEETNMNFNLGMILPEIKNNKISRFAHYDKFIALPNRVLFNELLNKAISHAKRHNKILAILIISIEPTNSITPSLGSNLDENAVKEIGNRLALSLRNEDVIAKLDGNEFIVLLNDIGKSKFASSVAKKLLSVCENPVQVDFQEIFLKSSIGICIYPNDGHSLEDLIQKAYNALHKAKGIENNAYQFYAESLDSEAREYSRLESDLRKAIQNNELALYYQPKLNIKSGSVVGVEALLRWMHPELGIVTPAKFIQIAEDTGFIMQIGEWALREACRLNKYWQEEGYEHLSVAMNLSPKQFYHPDMFKIIEGVLKESGLEPIYLEIEISEATVMDSPDKAIEILNAFKTLGVQLSIDHFGTGYTSINHLKRFPVTILKIDRNFIKGIPDRPDDSAIVSAIISMGHNLGMEVVAEGVETAEQVQYLTVQNCDVVQGYFLSYPLPSQKISQQFKKIMEKAIV